MLQTADDPLMTQMTLPEPRGVEPWHICAGVDGFTFCAGVPQQGNTAWQRSIPLQISSILLVPLLSSDYIISRGKLGNPAWIPKGSPSRGGDAAVYVFDRNQPSLPTLFDLFFVSMSVFVALQLYFFP